MKRFAAIATLALFGYAVLIRAGVMPAAAQEQAVVIPAPPVDAAPGQASSEVAVLAGGCFWGVQGVYQHV